MSVPLRRTAIGAGAALAGLVAAVCCGNLTELALVPDAGGDATAARGANGGAASGGASSGGLDGPMSSGGTQGGSAGASIVDAGEGADSGDGSCYRDPYLPDNFVPPCEQPEARANCDGGWCTVEPGCFIMGAPWCEWGRARDSTNPVQVTLTRRFRIQQYELTQAEWVTQGLQNPSGLSGDGTGDCIASSCPVGNVTWIEALAFANLLSVRAGLPECYELSGCTGALGEGMLCDGVRTNPAKATDCIGYRLPTGSEWEYAARAGTRTSVYSGEVIDRADVLLCVDDPVLSPIAWYCANAGNTSHPVGQKEPNGFGLYDMIGNAGEWVASLEEAYSGGPHTDWGAELQLENMIEERVLVQRRGGIFYSKPSGLRAAVVTGVTNRARFPAYGFRLVQSLP